MFISKRLLAFSVAAFALAGCNHTETALSPLVGSWKINGSIPAPAANLPEFTAFTFKADGAVNASYVAAAGALGHIVQSAPQIKQERDSYTLPDASSLRILEGSRELDYTYEIHDDHLLLTPSGGGDAVVYARVAHS